MQRLRASRRDFGCGQPHLWSSPGLKHALGKCVRGEGTRTAEAMECDLLVGFSRLDGRPNPLRHLSSSSENASFPKAPVPPPKERGATMGGLGERTVGGSWRRKERWTTMGRGLPRGHWKQCHKPAPVFDGHLKGSGYTSASMGPSLGHQLNPRTPRASPSPESHLPPDPMATGGAAETHRPGSTEKMILCAFLFRC